MREVPQARQGLKKLLVKPLQFMPSIDGDSRHYEFTAQIALGRASQWFSFCNLGNVPKGIRD